jgi:hypothetical protein
MPVASECLSFILSDSLFDAPGKQVNSMPPSFRSLVKDSIGSSASSCTIVATLTHNPRRPDSGTSEAAVGIGVSC